MLNIKFYSVAERKPKCGDEIIYLKPVSSFGSEGFRPTETTVEYCWFEKDEDGDFNGCQICYNEGDENDPPENCSLEIMFDDYIAQPDWFWCTIDEYWNYFDEANK